MPSVINTANPAPQILPVRIDSLNLKVIAATIWPRWHHRTNCLPLSCSHATKGTPAVYFRRSIAKSGEGMPPLNSAAKFTPAALIFALLIAVSTSPLHGQMQHKGPAASIALAKTLASFDVASIKLHNSAADQSDQQTFNMSIGDNLLTASNVSVEMLIEFAYDVKSDQLSGVAGPVSSAHFDIEAKVLATGDGKQKLTDEQLQAMIITLLVDRFQLKAHLQPRILPVYDLVVQRAGLKIKLTPGEFKDSSMSMNFHDTSKVLNGKGITMSDLAGALADDVHRKVIDKTGLEGHADITLKWSDDVAAEQGGANVISIFTALEEQLGLKLQPSKGPVDTLVIDHVEMPSEN
jgi:uncharacterized protein (TIGR03435 family)